MLRTTIPLGRSPGLALMGHSCPAFGAARYCRAYLYERRCRSERIMFERLSDCYWIVPEEDESADYIAFAEP